MALDAALLTAIASPRRREILRLTWDEERSAGEIHRAMPDVTFGAVSLQLKALVDAGLLASRSERRFRYYRARPAMLGPSRASLAHMWRDALWGLRPRAERERARRGPRPGRRRGDER